MKRKLIFDWLDFTSIAVIPTIMIGRGASGGWVYLYWLKGRFGLCWWREK